MARHDSVTTLTAIATATVAAGIVDGTIALPLRPRLPRDVSALVNEAVLRSVLYTTGVQMSEIRRQLPFGGDPAGDDSSEEWLYGYGNKHQSHNKYALYMRDQYHGPGLTRHDVGAGIGFRTTKYTYMTVCEGVTAVRFGDGVALVDVRVTNCNDVSPTGNLRIGMPITHDGTRSVSALILDRVYHSWPSRHKYLLQHCAHSDAGRLATTHVAL